MLKMAKNLQSGSIHRGIVKEEYFVILVVFVLRIYGPVNPRGSCWARSDYLTTLLLGRLSPLSG